MTDHNYVINNLTSFEYEVHTNTGNGNYVNQLKLVWSKFVKSQQVNYICGWFYPLWTNVRRPTVTKALPAAQPALTRPASWPPPRTFAAFKGWWAGLLVELCQRHSATTWRRLLRPNFEAVFEDVSTEPLLLRLALGLRLILLEASGTCAGASP